MQDGLSDLETILEEHEFLEESFEEEEHPFEEMYGIDPREEEYFMDPSLIEVGEAIEEVSDGCPEPEEKIREVEGPEVIEIPHEQSEILEKPELGEWYGPRYR